MAGNKSHFISDILGVLRGVHIIHSQTSILPNQRRVLLQRQLTPEQRAELSRGNQENLDFLNENEQTQPERRNDIPFQEQIIKPQVQEKIDAFQEKILHPEAVVQQQPLKIDQIPVEPIKNLVIEPIKEVIQETQHQHATTTPQNVQDDLGESSFGKSQQQNTKVVEDDSTPFFMKQDRPKFSAQERYVPASSTSRAFQFGILGVQLIGGTVSEAGFSTNQDSGLTGIKKYAANEKNADRLQKTFRKMRGAVLKLGQILSTSEESVVPPVIREAMEKARSEADIMPIKQVVKILEKELGSEWQKNFREINLYPFAAASVGQVHEALLKNGQRVALKIQYNGVGNSIDSDLNNFKRLVTLFGAPRGLYLNELVETTRTELYWETDYLREARYQKAYRERLTNYPEEYYCPKVYDDLVTKHILCTEFIDGVEIDTILDQPQHVRDRAGSLLLKLCFKELFEWKIMQTDPNPANFLYDLQKQRLHLLDFGSGRDFDQFFLDGYIQIIHGSFTQNKEKIMENSLKLKFLTGEENKEMLNAHYAGALAIGEPFRHNQGLYDFGNQQITKNIYEIIPAMSKHRLTPPPKEIYSLHRKIMGTYLMCIKLRAHVPARKIFEDTYDAWLKTTKVL